MVNKFSKMYTRSKLMQSEFPIKLAASIAIHNSEGKVLIAKRADWVSEFKGIWSLPSKFINDDDADMMGQIIHAYSEDWFAIKLINQKFATRRIALRKYWRLQMNLFCVDTNEKPIIQTDKYTDFAWVEGRHFFTQTPFKKLGDCAKCYLNFIEVNGDE